MTACPVCQIRLFDCPSCGSMICECRGSYGMGDSAMPTRLHWKDEKPRPFDRFKLVELTNQQLHHERARYLNGKHPEVR